MAELENQLKEALENLRKEKERKFDQTVDLVINLQKYSHKKNPINLFITVPHKTKDKKIAAFLESDSNLIDTITFNDFKKYNDKKKLKNLVKKYDFFIAQGKIMPKVATTFGRVLGPTGKMPSPQLGIILNADEELKEKINTSVKLRVKESSIKIPVGKQSMSDKDLIENIMAIYNEIIKVLPRDKENIKNIELKFTMTKPIKIQLR
jgi:large subunit ribosomal protein L1